MKLLLDTHVFIWALAAPERLTAPQFSALEDPTNRVYVSAICITELAVKASLGKLELDFDPITAVEQSQFDLLSFSARDAIGLRDLPFHHRDPFDRMLISQALAQDLTLVTQDPMFSHYECRILS